MSEWVSEKDVETRKVHLNLPQKKNKKAQEMKEEDIYPSSVMNIFALSLWKGEWECAF